jgi:ribose transport system ATP-binding protein
MTTMSFERADSVQPPPPSLLELRDITKGFPGVRALENVKFDLRPGEIHALVGENGAGKSTLVKILSGVYQPDRGEIWLRGTPARILSPAHAQLLGISPVHQELQLEPYLSVAENIFLGRQPTGRLGIVDHQRMHREARHLLDSLGVTIDSTAPIESISIAQRQIVAIARAVLGTARVIIFDEPTSSLTERETALLFEMISKLRKTGIGIIYISHRIEEIFRLCDRVTVLRDGRYIATKPVGETNRLEVIALMIGRDISDLFKKEVAPIGETVLEVRGLSKKGLLHDISFSLRRGEIVGLAGLVGAGRTDLARAIFGDITFEFGDIVIAGKTITGHHTPRRAISVGIALVPEDRKEQGLVLGLSVRKNISLAMLPALSRLAFIRASEEKRLTRSYVEQLTIKTPSIDQKTLYLSGGNQQRVVIAKWLATQPKVLIVDEPTRGIDVRAKASIHSLLCDLAKQGVAILMISSDLPEILAMSDRILVMHRGRITGELSGGEATQEAIMHYATG